MQDGDKSISTRPVLCGIATTLKSRDLKLYATEYILPVDQTASDFCRSLKREESSIPAIIYDVFAEILAKVDAIRPIARFWPKAEAWQYNLNSSFEDNV